jgi:hypothetical protein
MATEAKEDAEGAAVDESLCIRVGTSYEVAGFATAPQSHRRFSLSLDIFLQ